MAGFERGARDLREHVHVLWRRKFTIFFTTLVLAAAALGLSELQTPIYEARAKLILESSNSASVFAGSQSNVNREGDVGTAIQVIKSEPVAALVRKAVGDPGTIGAVQVGETNVIQLSARSRDRRRAVKLVDAYANAYVEFRRDRASSNALSAGLEVQSKIDELQHQIDDLNAKIAAAPAPQRAAVAQSLGSQRDALVTQQSLFKQRLDQLQVAAALQANEVQAVTPVLLPKTPVEPKPIRNALLGVALGLALGIILALVADYFDDKIDSRRDLEHASQGIPTLGFVPVLGPRWRRRRQPAVVVSRTEPSSPAAEAYRTLRTSLRFLDQQRPIRMIQVTSATAGEGKTTTVANLAWVFATAGQRVVIVDCDLRKPRIHEFFGLSNTVGYTSVVQSQVPLADAIQPVPGEPRLMVLASGPPPTDPAELLGSARAAEVLEALRHQADVVVIDSAPAIPVTDAALVAVHVEATLVVVAAEKTTEHDVRRTIELLRQVDAPLVGTVFNGVTARAGYGYGYTSYYRSEGTGDALARRPAANA